MRYHWYRVKKFVVPALCFGVNLAVALFWVALRVNYAGISKFLGADTNPSFLVMNLPLMVAAAAWISCGLSLIGLTQWEKHRWPTIAALVLGVIFLAGAVVVVLFGAKDYIRFILPHFWESLIVAGAIVAFAILLFFPILGRTGLKWAILAAVTILAVVMGYQLRPCTFTYGAVVYAVEDTYQIVYSTSDSAIAWVEVGGESYYDLYAGSMKSVDGVHKITVPQEVLDEAGGYTICAKQMIYRGPFGGYTGETISQSYDFRPVDDSDGIHYFSMSDVHEAVDAAAAAAAQANEQPWDFIVLLGDLVSMVETEKDVQIANELAHKVTGGGIPVIYARGNHEIKGEYAEELYKYVGSKNESFAYWVTLGDDEVFTVVLDMGEDHEDDWWEYYGTAQFDLYRAEQTRMLENILEEKLYENYRYRLALCHIPVVYVDKNGYFEQFRNEWVELLNEMELDMCLSGHKHVLWAFIPGQVEPYETLVYSQAYSGKEGKKEGGYLTDFNFPGFLVGRRSFVQEGGTHSDYKAYVGLTVSVDGASGTQSCSYRNSLGETLTCVYPFSEDSYKNLVLPLARSK